MVTLSHGGYAKSQPVTEYHAQRRGGRGRSATAIKDEDFIDKLFVANTHDTLLCFSSRGKLYWLKVYQLPQAGRGSRGKPIVNLLPLEEGERINAVLPIREFEEDKFVFMATSQRHGQEDAAGRVLAAAHRRHHRRRAARTTTSWSASASPTASATSCCSPATARRSASPRTTCARWAATRAGVRGISLPRRRARDRADHRRPQGLILIATENGYGKLHVGRRVPGRMVAAARASSPSRPPSATASWSARSQVATTMSSC